MGLFLLVLSDSSLAASLEVDQTLSFGTLAARDNSAESSVRVRHHGLPVTSVDGAGGLLLVGSGRPGRYLLRDLPSQVPLSIKVVAGDSLTLGGQGSTEQLRLEAFTFDNLSADINGEAVLLLGATARSSGNSQPYAEGPYIGTFDIEVRYWSQPDQIYITQTFGQWAEAELRTTVSLELIEPLQFGTLSAFTDPVQIAKLTLAPSGSLVLDNQAPATIGITGGSTPGHVRVSGAAALQKLTLEIDPPTLYLTHTSNSPESARFFVRDFTHAPSGENFRADSNGVLEFRVGASIETETTTLPYMEGDYAGVVTVVVNY